MSKLLAKVVRLAHILNFRLHRPGKSERESQDHHVSRNFASGISYNASIAKWSVILARPRAVVTGFSYTASMLVQEVSSNKVVARSAMSSGSV